MGLGDVVDSPATVIWHMEARYLSRASHVHADVLELGVSAWNVCAGEPAPVTRGGVPTAPVDIGGNGVDCTGNMGRHWVRTCICFMAKPSAVCPIKLPSPIELT